VRLATEDPAGLPSEVRALAYLAMVGEPCPGDTVLLNVSALVKGLGTGGLALVVAVPDRLPPDVDGPGHIVKARYTPQQQMFLAIDEQDSPHHALSDLSPTRAHSGACRWSSPICTRRSPRSSPGSGPTQPGPAGRLRHDRRGCAPHGVLPVGGRPHRRRLAGLDDHRRPGLRWGARGGDAPQRPGRGSTSARRRHRRRDPGAGQRRHRHTLGLLRGCRRPRPSMPPGLWAAPGSVPCGCPSATPAGGTEASRTTAEPPTGGSACSRGHVPVRDPDERRAGSWRSRSMPWLPTRPHL
jgi:hypothetical protein